MSDILSETKACDLLSRVFKKRGYAVARNVAFREYGVTFHIDGWDAAKRVGFEFLTSEDDDHDDLTLAEYQTLMDAQHRGELALFIIDEVEPLSAADLTETANAFLDEMEAAASMPRRKAKQAAKGVKRTAKTKPAQKKSRQAKAVTKGSLATKNVATKVVTKKVIAKKAAAKKAVPGGGSKRQQAKSNRRPR